MTATLVQEPAKAAGAVNRRLRPCARIGLILGSGFKGLTEGLSKRKTISYGAIPGLPTPSVEHLVRWRDGVVVGTSRGAVYVVEDEVASLADVGDQAVSMLRVNYRLPSPKLLHPSATRRGWTSASLG